MTQKKYNIFTILAVIIVCGALFYRHVLLIPEEFDSSDASMVEEKISQLFNKVNSIDLNFSVFSENKFSTLKNIESDLPNISLGRENPFSSILSNK